VIARSLAHRVGERDDLTILSTKGESGPPRGC